MVKNQNLEKSTDRMEIKRKKLLIVEDEIMLVRIYENKLTVSGFEVDYAVNGLDAIEKLKVGDYDLILLDIMLPKVSGFEVLKQLRASKWPTAKKPVIIFSNLGNTSDIHKSRDLGANDYLIKASLTPNQVVDKVQEHLEKERE